MESTPKAPLATLAIALAVLTAAVSLWGWNKPLDPGFGDASQYMMIGRSLMNGNGYVDTLGLWPDRPSYDRMPGWPLTIAAFMAVGRWASDTAVVHAGGVVCLAAAAAFLTMLSQRLGIGPGLSIVAGLGLAFSPAAVALAFSGLSETLFLFLLSAGSMAFLAGGRWRYGSALSFGLASLVRTNFILFPAILLFFLLVIPSARKRLWEEQPRRIVLLMALAYLPILLWAARNYPLTGRVFYLSSIEGETLYGSNNALVANDLTYWGAWVVPGELTGDAPKGELAKGRTDAQLSDYYHSRAVAWIKAHLREYPRLVLGKLIRGFVPMPWIPLLGTWVAFSYRFLLDVLFIALARWWWPAVNRQYLLLLGSMFAIVLITTVIYYGNYRFTHCAELFFLPCIVLGWKRLRERAAT